MLRLLPAEFKAKEIELVDFIKEGIVLDPKLLRNFRGAIRAKIAYTALVSPLNLLTMDFSSSKMIPTCTTCQKPGSLICTACDNAPPLKGEIEKTYYCTRKCQVADQKEHKASCARLRTLKTIYRAGELLQRFSTCTERSSTH
jgi:hypothetical protein